MEWVIKFWSRENDALPAKLKLVSLFDNRKFYYTVDVRASSHVTFGAGLPLNEHSNLSSFSATPKTFALPSASWGATNFGASELWYKIDFQG